MTEQTWWGGRTSLPIETNAVRVTKITRTAAEKLHLSTAVVMHLANFSPLEPI